MRIKSIQIPVFATCVWLSCSGANPAAIAQTSAPAAPVLVYTDEAEAVVWRRWELGLQGAIAIGGLVGLGLLASAVRRSRQQQAWQRADLARRTVEAFCQKEAVQRVLQILNFEEYRDLQIQVSPVTLKQVPGSPLRHTSETIQFEATDARLQRSLRRHGEMVKLKQGFNQILAGQAPPSADLKFDLNQAIADFQQEYSIELTLRDWFDEFLSGLSHFNAMIESDLVSAKDFEPYIKTWIHLIADRDYRRESGSNFYDQLFLYIHHSMYTGVQDLFKRYGFTIISPPYKPADFIQFLDHKIPTGYDTGIAIALAKAAYLSYEDEDYIKDIVQSWAIGNAFPDYRAFTDAADFVYKVMAYCHDPNLSERRDRATAFRFFDRRGQGSDTQAYAFKISHLIILVFRGTQQPQDWLTNADFIQANLNSTSQVAARLKGQVHNGFQSGWNSIQSEVLAALQEWQEPGDEIWVTGHSLGGALATLAAATLAEKKLPITRLYTFGQPRTGNGYFVEYFNQELKFGDRGQRFVNNTDIVPRMPLRGLSWRFWIAPWNWRSLYGHGGQLRYFNFRGKLWKNSVHPARFFDVVLGAIVGIWVPGWEFITHHSMGLYLLNLQKAYEDEQVAAERERREKETQITMQK